MAYLNGGALDHPLAEIRTDGAASSATLAPRYNWRGLAEEPVCAAGQSCGTRDASGLVYKRNRYYDPASGRFTSQDPLGIGGGLNVYGFANGDPVNQDDPFGLTCLVRGSCTQADVAGPDPSTDASDLGLVVASSRPKFWKRTVKSVWDDAAPGPNGGKLCPTCGKEVDVVPGTGKRDWDIDHMLKWGLEKLRGEYQKLSREAQIENYKKSRICASGAHPVTGPTISSASPLRGVLVARLKFR